MGSPTTMVFIGRFQPFHLDHMRVLEAALALAEKVVVVLGSSFRSRDIRNPFSVGERTAMIRASVAARIPGAEERVKLCAVADSYDDQRWVHQVRGCVEALVGRVECVGLTGHLKDGSSYYLRNFPMWQWMPADCGRNLSSSDLRATLFEDGPLSAISAAVPPPVLHFLVEWRQTEAFRSLQEEFRDVQESRRSWSAAPHPPIFVTADAVLHSRGRVLMVRRAGHPGKGLWALPGGFVNQNERIRDAALRELFEETAIGLTRQELESCSRGERYFDHPARSVRGRTVTHAFFFDLDRPDLPPFAASDDAAEARWVPLDELNAVPEQVFEDHLHIINLFLD